MKNCSVISGSKSFSIFIKHTAKAAIALAEEVYTGTVRERIARTDHKIIIPEKRYIVADTGKKKSLFWVRNYP